jgi:hypothetical protein
MNKLKFKRIIFFTIITFCTSCYKQPEQPAEIPVIKSVQFRIAQGYDYSSPIYDGLKAELKLSVAKESIIDGRILAAWDTTFSLRSIREYAVITNPETILKQFNDVWQSRQVLRVSRVVKYVNAAGQISQSSFGETIPALVDVKQVEVNM